MAYQWTSEEDGPQQAEQIPHGKHLVKISKLIFAKRNGEVFLTKNGDPQFLVIYQDQLAREVADMLTISVAAAWRLRQVLAAFDPPINMARLEADGVEPHHFAVKDFAEKQMLDRQLTIEIKAGKSAKYPDITPVRLAATEVTPLAIQPPSAVTPAATAPTTPPPAVPAGMTKDEAWQCVVAKWAEIGGSEEQRNSAWLDAYKKAANGRPEDQLTPQDWKAISDLADPEIPF